MSFNSYEFLFLFLPAFLVLFLALRPVRNCDLTATLIVIASILFYALGDGASVGYLLLTLAVTYGIGWKISSSDAGRQRKSLLAAGLIVSISPLVFYKYPDAFTSALYLEADGWVMPLAMSFVVFQQVIFLVEMGLAKSRCPRFLDYLAAVLFFPKLISGPLASVVDVAGQMRERMPTRDLGQDFAIGITYFCMGLFKKVVISDRLRPGVDAVFAGLMAGGEGVPLLDAWAGLVTFFVMLYFDFSGYSDMAIGIARICGIVLPFNFNSPLKSVSLTDFWSRWHMTLMKFLVGFVYNPLALWRTRAAMAAKRNKGRLFIEAAVVPAILTMLVSGIWHGGGWNFVIFGLAHGIGLSVNQAWRQFNFPRLPLVLAWALTFLFVLLTLILFRAPDPTSAWWFVKSLVGATEIRLPAQIAEVIAGWLGVSIIGAHPGQNFVFFLGGAGAVATSFAALGFALVAPNSQQVMGEAKASGWHGRIRWSPRSGWAVATALLTIASVAMLSTEYQRFVYFGF
jgi:D-alanyl-lipoteichoic acid acyltransferase DltB (MBOAT superfamily)